MKIDEKSKRLFYKLYKDFITRNIDRFIFLFQKVPLSSFLLREYSYEIKQNISKNFLSDNYKINIKNNVFHITKIFKVPNSLNFSFVRNIFHNIEALKEGVNIKVKVIDRIVCVSEVTLVIPYTDIIFNRTCITSNINKEDLLNAFLKKERFENYLYDILTFSGKLDAFSFLKEIKKLKSYHYFAPFLYHTDLSLNEFLPCLKDYSCHKCFMKVLKKIALFISVIERLEEQIEYF